MSAAVERLAPLSRRVNAEPLQIEPLAQPVDALAFVNDPRTAEVLAALFGATSQGRVQFGGINAAIQVLQSAPCPHVLVIDIAGIGNPLGHLDRLADLCPEGTGVVLVGADHEEALVAEFRAMGISHYLEKPVNAEVMRVAILAAAGEADFAAIPDAAISGATISDVAAATPGNIAPSDAVPPGGSADLEAAAPDTGFPTTADPLPYSRIAPPPGPAATPPAAEEGFMPTAPHFAAMAVPAAEPFASVGMEGPDGLPAAMSGEPGMGLPIGGDSEHEPLPRPIDLLAFLNEAQSAAVIAGLIGPQGAAGRVRPGGINAAVGFLKDNASPKVLIIDLSGVPEPMSRIDALAEVCAPGTMVIAIGAANDVALYRDLKNAGVYEYLVKPLQHEALKAVILEAASGGVQSEAAIGKPMFTVIGTRGGVGASTIAINLAGTLAKQGRKTILLDLDLQFGSVALTLDIDPGHGLREALDRPERVDSMFLNGSAVKVAENLYVLAAEEAVNEEVPVNGESLAALMLELQRHFDALVVDMPRHVVAANWETIGMAHAVLLVADLSLVGIRDTTRLLTASRDSVDPAKIKLMISSTGSDRGAKIDRKEFEAALSRKADYVLPEDSKSVSAANRAGRTIVDVAGNSRIATALSDVCVDLLGRPEAPAAPRRKRSVISLFSRKDKS